MDSHVEDTVSNTCDGTVTGAKKGRKRKAKHDATALVESKKVKKWKNKQRVLVFCARGVTYRARHLMTDLRSLMPHSRADTKLDRKEDLATINESLFNSLHLGKASCYDIGVNLQRKKSVILGYCCPFR
eukprot:Em0020g626a